MRVSRTMGVCNENYIEELRQERDEAVNEVHCFEECVASLNRQLVCRERDIAAYKQVAEELAARVGISPLQVTELVRAVLLDGEQATN